MFRYNWQAIPLLPFIDQERLLAALETLEPTLTPEEKVRNSAGQEYIFMHVSHPLANTVTALFQPEHTVFDENVTAEETVLTQDQPLDGGGSVLVDPEATLSLISRPVILSDPSHPHYDPTRSVSEVKPEQKDSPIQPPQSMNRAAVDPPKPKNNSHNPNAQAAANLRLLLKRKKTGQPEVGVAGSEKKRKIEEKPERKTGGECYRKQRKRGTKLIIDPTESGGMNGQVCIFPRSQRLHSCSALEWRSIHV